MKLNRKCCGWREIFWVEKDKRNERKHDSGANELASLEAPNLYKYNQPTNKNPTQKKTSKSRRHLTYVYKKRVSHPRDEFWNKKRENSPLFKRWIVNNLKQVYKRICCPWWAWKWNQVSVKRLLYLPPVRTTLFL